MNNHKVTIIIPIYNVAKYIERCVVSLFEQDFEDIEYIFVNDCTPDNSVEILEKIIEKYPNRKPNIRIIHHEKNKGLGSARKTGLEHATGEYIIHIDSDDWCELDMISALYNKAKETDADIVACDYFDSFKDKDIYKKQNYSVDIKEDLCKILSMELMPSLCNKLIKRELYVKNNLCPPTEISTAEDRWLVARLFAVAESIAYVPKAFLHYWKENESSLSAKLNPKVLDDLMWYSKTTEAFFKEKGIFEHYKKYLYIGDLREVLYCTKGVNYKIEVKRISPQSDKLSYLWQIKGFNFFVKMIYSLCVLNLECVVAFLHFLQLNVLYKRVRNFVKLKG